jgi:hypothetical protein
LNEVLAGEDGKILRLKDDGAFVTDALLAAGGVDNDTTQPRGLDEICAGVDANLPAVRLKSDNTVFHFVNR